jgi:hypothetical protein
VFGVVLIKERREERKERSNGNVRQGGKSWIVSRESKSEG